MIVDTHGAGKAPTPAVKTARRAADSDAVVLLRGESGTGKTALACWMRLRSRQADGPFVTAH